MPQGYNDRDLNDLTRSVLYEEIPNQNLMRLTIVVIGFAFSLFVGWSSFTHVNEVARSQGEIIPSGYSQIVQHLEGGIISQINIQEGDLVERGQVLVRMGVAGANEDYKALFRRQSALQLQSERLQALAHDSEPDFSQFADGDQKAVEYQRRLLRSARDAYESERVVLENQLSQKQNALLRLQEQTATSKKELKSAREILTIRKKLEEKGNVARRTVITSEVNVTRLEGKIRTESAQIAEAKQAITEYINRLKKLKVQKRDKALLDLENVSTQIAQNQETLHKLQQRVKRMAVRAPVRGVVKGLRINTVGGVVSSGQPIAEIVPLDETLIVEAKIPPREIGNLRIGQLARVKVSAFDFSRYGVIEGTLEFLSATTFTDKDNSSYYKARIELKKGYVGIDPQRNLILPGMTVEVDIITGEKTVLAYLLKPIHRSLTTSFQER